MDLNGLEFAILLLWVVVGIGPVVHTGRRVGFTARAWIVAGSVLAISYATFATADLKRPFPQ